MNKQVAIQNFEFFEKECKPDDEASIRKMYATENGSVWKDDRWLQSLRRTYSRDSRKDIIEPIYNTWVTILENREITDWDRHRAVVNQLSSYLKKLYGIPDFDETFAKTFQQIRIMLTDAERNERTLHTVAHEDDVEDSYEDVVLERPPTPVPSSTCPSIKLPSPTQKPKKKKEGCFVVITENDSGSNGRDPYGPPPRKKRRRAYQQGSAGAFTSKATTTMTTTSRNSNKQYQDYMISSFCDIPYCGPCPPQNCKPDDRI